MKDVYKTRILNPTIEKNFTYHKPKDGQVEKYTELRENAKNLAYLIVENCPDTAERTNALQKLEETVMWANASIARN